MTTTGSGDTQPSSFQSLSQVTTTQWRAFWATFLGWVLDAFDFNILSFIILDIQNSFTVDRALAGALGTVTLAMRLVGGVAAGSAADKWGRKLPMLLSILWFSLFACLSGFSTSYAMLFAFRALFGIGMGGEWAAGMPLVLEHWPARLRGLVSGMLLGGWYWGYLLAAAAFQFIYPLFDGTPDTAWRVMFWLAAGPALFTIWIRKKVPESPLWLERQRVLALARAEGRDLEEPKVSLLAIFRRPLLGTTLQTSLLLGAFMCSFYSIGFWYPTLLREGGRAALPYLVAFNVGAIIGTASWGRLSETALGRRGAVTLAALLGLTAIPLYIGVDRPSTLWIGAFIMGACGCGIWGMAPAYLSERFPTSVRGVGPGFSYHAGAAMGSLAPLAIGAMQDGGTALSTAMATAMLLSGGLVAVVIWMGPETRGRALT